MSISSKSRILVVSQHFWPESFRVNDLCDFLASKEVDIEVLCGLPNYPEGYFYKGYGYFGKRHEIHNGVRVNRVMEIQRAKNSNFRIVLNYLSFPFFSLFHVPRLLFHKYDKIFVFQTSPVYMALPAIIIGKLKRVETTIYVLDLWPENLFSVLDIKNKFFRRLVTWTSHWYYRRADKLIALTDQMKEQLMEVTGKSSDKIAVLPQAAEKIYEAKVTDKKLAERFEGKFNILFTGNISPAQSFETIIAAAKKLEDDGVSNINWIIVGDGMSRKWLEDEVKKANLKNWYFEGFKPITDVPKYTNFADLLIACLSKSQLLEATVPAKVLSYFAAGKPMVLAMDGEARTLINEKSKAGLAGPTEDSDTLAANIRKIYEMNDAERQAMGKRAHDYHLKHFERNLVLNKLFHFVFDSRVK